MSVYEGMVRARGRRAYARLILAGLLLVGVTELVMTRRGTDHVWVMEACYGAWLTFLPSVVVFVRRRWFAAHRRFFATVDLDHQGTTSGRWLTQHHRVIFAASRPAAAAALTVAGTGVATIVNVPSAYDDLVTNAVALGYLVLVLLTAGHFLYMIMRSAGSLRSLARTALRTRFLGLDTREIRRFDEVWLTVSVFASLSYGLFFTATLFSPYSGNPAVTVWLWIASSVPFVAVFYNLSTLRQIRIRLKDEQVGLVVRVIDDEVRRGAALTTTDSAERVAAMGSVLQQVQAMRSLPISMTAAYSFLIASVPIGIQLVQLFTAKPQ